jgi:hypothetical protein
MFCLMDVSGSMDEARKDMAKRFFILLYLFLTRHYEKIELVFIRHHTQAQEVTEEEFFHATETGGTVVSSALVLMDEIIKARYPSGEWNIYGAQASDGDNWHQDSGRCRELLVNKILPLVRYYAYVQVAETEQNLWEEYAQLRDVQPNFAMRKVTPTRRSIPVFRDLFKKEGVRHELRHATTTASPSPACFARPRPPPACPGWSAAAQPVGLDLRADRRVPHRDRADRARLRLDTYPNQLEVITAEQMMDAYASVGMPVNYRHWSYGKQFISTEKNYRAATWGWRTRSSSTPTPASPT